MKVLILAGGLGTRLAEETSLKPKPMVEIGGYPILWHIMKIYAAQGHSEFVILCGFKGHVIKEYFYNFLRNQSDFTIDFATNEIQYINTKVEPWKITLVDTGANTLTGGRVKRVQELLGNERFLLTYGDGVSDIDINASIDFHMEQQAMVTLAAIKPPGRFGTLALNPGSSKVESFREKVAGDGSDSTYINGGFFVVEPQALQYIAGDHTIWEREPLETIASIGKLSAYKHHGFWHPMDTLRDRQELEELWNTGKAPWKIWN